METAALSFEREWVLTALWLLPLLVALFWWSEQRRKAAIGRIVAPKLRSLLAGNASPLRRWFRSACVVAALALLVSALAGPRLGYDTLEVPHRGRDVIIAVDVSRSMLARDVAPSRLDRAKLLAEDLVSELGGDRIGLVAFAGSSFLQAPLTLDHGAVLTAVDELDTSVIPKGGSNLAAAIRTADEAFGKAEGFSRAVVIISDGEELDADGVTAAKNAAEQGVRIFTVGVGSAEGAEIPDGSGEFIRDPRTREIVNSRLDEARMKEIAEATGGFYTRLDGSAAARIANEGIGKLAEADITANTSRRPIERYQWPLGAAIALLMLQAMVGERRRRIAAAGLLMFALLPSATRAAPAGIESYNAGDYKAAGEAFESRLRLEPDSLVLQLNAGAAAYRQKDYARASQYFSRAALADDLSLRAAAEYNFANTLFRQGEGQQDKEKKLTDWKDAVAQYDAALKTRPDYTEAKENKERVEELIRNLEEEQQQEEEQEQQQDQNNQEQNQEQQNQDEQQNQQQNDDQQSQGGQQQDGDKENSQDDQNQQSGSGQDSNQEKDQQQQDQKESEENNEQQQDKEEQGNQQDQQDEKSEDGEEQSSADGKNKDTDQGDEQQSPAGSPGENGSQSGESSDQPGPVPQQPQDKKEGELRGSEPLEGGAEEDNQGQAPVAGEEVEEGKMSASQARALLRTLESEEDKVDLLERQVFQDVSRDW